MKKYLVLLFLFFLTFTCVACKSQKVTYEEILTTDNYIVYKGNSNNLTEYINFSELENKTEDKILERYGDPSYIIEYKSKDSEIFDCKILIYSYYRTTDMSYISLKNNNFTEAYTDAMNGMDSDRVENIIDNFSFKVNSKLYSQDEVLDIITLYNSVIIQFNKLLTKIENKDLTKDEFNNYFSEDYELRNDNKIYHKDVNLPIFELGTKYTFYQNGFDFITDSTTKTFLFFESVPGKDSFDYWHIDFENKNSNWIIKNLQHE